VRRKRRSMEGDKEEEDEVVAPACYIEG